MALTPDPPYVLVVDDDPVSREVVGDALYQFGSIPLMASSGRDALDFMAGASAPALIVLAARLIDMPVRDLLAMFRADERWARARVLLTAAVPRTHLRDDMRIDGFIQKPFNVEAVLGVAQAVMRT